MLYGSCLCGSIKYSVEKLAGPVVHCHCRTCQKAHSSVFASTARVERSQFSWLQGAGCLKYYESSPGKKRWSCGECGSHLMAEWVDQPSVILRVVSLDITAKEAVEIEVKAHIWTSHDNCWLTYGNDVPAFTAVPN